MSCYMHFSISGYLKTVHNMLLINKNRAGFINKNCLLVNFLSLLVCLLPIGLTVSMKKMDSLLLSDKVPAIIN